MSHALRHQPWVYELEMDEEGWVSLKAVLSSLRRLGPDWAELDRSDIELMIERSSKRRHELTGERIRALYGHSVPGRLVKVPGEPPARLFHGTAPSAWAAIEDDGLRPMGRQFVHLSVDIATAEQVGLRKSPHPVILTVDAQAAYRAGVRFWIGNEAVWLVETVPAEFVDTRAHRSSAISAAVGGNGTGV